MKERLKKFFNKENGNFIKLLIFIILIIKTGIFLKIGTSQYGTNFKGRDLPTNIFTIIAYLSLIAIIVLSVFLFKGKNQLKYLIFVDCMYTLLLIADLWYYRATGSYLGLKLIVYKEFFNPLDRSLINPNILDLLFIVDIPIFISLIKKIKFDRSYNRKVLVFVSGIVVCSIAVLGVHYILDIKNITDGKTRFVNAETRTTIEISNASPIGYHIYEILQTIKKETKEPNEAQMQEVDEWLKWNNEKLPDNKYKGMIKGKNVVFLQVESLETFVLNQKVYGQEITPVLNDLMKNSLYFDNIHEQNNKGHSIDCDLMVNTGMLTLGDSITFVTHPEVKYPSLPRILNDNGYYTVSTHAEPGGDWKWSDAHKYGLGFEKSWGMYDYDMSDKVGYGLSDESFLKQYAKKLNTIKEPFFSMIPTLSSHGPFDIEDEYRELKLPKEINENYLGGYFQSIKYTDKQIGMFIEKLKESGLMKDTILVIYGDHGGVHKYYNSKIKDMPLEGDWWKFEKYRHEIPLLIYGEDIKGEKFSVEGGQSDITPTMLYLLGLNSDSKFMGRNLLNTNRNATVIKGNKIYGKPKSKEEEDRLKEAYKIAEYIIKNNYFVNRGIIEK
ncbi:LTA synthase family protein [Clostridium sp.]|uniref:LTA synthase family protein n=1 Tax=Clostridium sp. TaxID=1506 RepID=UPI002FC6A0CA